MEKLIRYKNIGLLDLRAGTEAAFHQISELVNVGTLVIMASQGQYLGAIQQKNIGNIVVIPDNLDVQLVQHNGDYVFDKDLVKHLDRTIYMIINGDVRINGDLQNDDFLNVFKLVINGNVTVPSQLKAMITLKAEVNGEINYFDLGDTLVKTPLVLNESALWAYLPGSTINVRRLIAIEPIAIEKLQEIFKGFKVKELITTQHMARQLAPYIDGFHEVEKTIIPEGYCYYEQLELNEASVRQLEKPLVYVGSKLLIKQLGPDPEGMINALEGVICDKLLVSEDYADLIAPKVVKANQIQVLSRKSKENYGKLRIDNAYLMANQSVVMSNYGKLEFSNDVTEANFVTGIQSIDNYGKILCAPSIYSLVMGKLKQNYGLVKTTQEETLVQEEHVTQDQEGWEKTLVDISNLGTYKL